MGLPIHPLSVKEEWDKRLLYIVSGYVTYLVCGEDYTFNLHVGHSFSKEMFESVWKFVESGVSTLEPVNEDDEHKFLSGFSHY